MSTSITIRLAAIFLGILAVIPSMHATPVKFLAWDEAIAARKLGFVNAGEVAELQGLHPHRRSNAINRKAGEAPSALVALDRAAEDGKPITIPLDFAPGLKSPLVLILPDPKHATGLRCFVMEDAADDFAWGTLRFINATGKEVLVRQDKEVKALPATWKAVDLNPGGDRRNISLQMALRSDLDKVLYSAVWDHNPDVRKLIIVVPGTSTDGGALDLKIIPEDRRAIAVEAPAADQAP